MRGFVLLRVAIEMKWILPLAFTIFSTSSFAYKITDYSGKCFTVNENKTESCLIQRGVSPGGGFIYLEVGQKEYLIEQSTTCGGNCKPYLGTTPEDVLPAKKYKKGQWDCYKQERGKLDLCYSISK